MDIDAREPKSLVYKTISSYRRFEKLLKERNHGRRMRHESLVSFDPFQGQGRILLQLSETSGVTQSRLATLLGVSQQSLSVSLKRLSATGLVTHERDPLDKRVKLVHLTSTGQAEVDRLKKRSKYSGSVFEALGKDEMLQLASIFDKLSEHLQHEIDAAQDIEA